MERTTHRAVESAGMIMIGDGVLAIVRPSEHCLLWRGGPQWWRRTIEWFASHPAVTRGVGVAEVAAGLWLALRQQPHLRTEPPADLGVGDVAF